MEDICAILGRNLRMWRHKRQLTQEELQAATGVSQQFLSELETGGRNPSLRMMAKIAAALEVEPVELLRNDPPRS